MPPLILLFSHHSDLSVSDCFCLSRVYVLQISHFHRCLLFDCGNNIHQSKRLVSYDMRVKKHLSVLSLPDSVADCLHSQTVFSTALSVPAVRLWLPKAQSNKVNPPSHGGGARWVGLSLSVLSLPDSVADSHHSHTDQHCPLSACCAIVFASKPRSPR